MQAFAIVVWNVLLESDVEVFDGFRYAIEALFLDSSIESLEMCVVVRSAYPRVSMHREHVVGEPLRPFAPVIALQRREVETCETLRTLDEPEGGIGIRTRIRTCIRPPREHIKEREDVHPSFRSHQVDGVDLH